MCRKFAAACLDSVGNFQCLSVNCYFLIRLLYAAVNSTMLAQCRHIMQPSV